MKRRFISLLVTFSILAAALAIVPNNSAFAQQANGFLNLPTILRGNVEIDGVATHDAFRKWQIDILINGDEKQASFVAVGEKPLSEPATLTTLNTAAYPDGVHKLRLRVAYTGLQYDEFFTTITIANSEAVGLPAPDETADNEPEQPNDPDNAANDEPKAKPEVVKAVVEYDPNNYARTLEVGSGYQPSEPIDRSATRTEIESAQAVDVVQLKTDVPDGPRRIEVDLSEQKLTAYQGDVPVMVTQISSGKKNGNDKLMYYTETVTGRYTIQRRYELNRMIGPGYDTPNVPYAQYFFRGYAIHGAYWHNEFGTPVSHGCINMRVEEARELFAWADIGTEIIITD